MHTPHGKGGQSQRAHTRTNAPAQPITHTFNTANTPSDATYIELPMQLGGDVQGILQSFILNAKQFNAADLVLQEDVFILFQLYIM